MDLAEMTAAVRDAIKADQTIASWCQQKYGRQHKVYVGIDDENPPAEEDYPLVAIIPFEHRWGLKSRLEEARAILVCGVVQKAVTSSGNVVEMVGISEVETLRRMVEERLFKAGLLLADSTADSLSGYFFPAFASAAEITIETKLSSRGPTAG
jgi:hypothetical protein